MNVCPLEALRANALEAVERHAAADVGEPARGVGDAAEGVQPAEALSEKRLVAVGQEEGALGGTFGVEVAEAVAEVKIEAVEVGEACAEVVHHVDPIPLGRKLAADVVGKLARGGAVAQVVHDGAVDEEVQGDAQEKRGVEDLDVDPP